MKEVFADAFGIPDSAENLDCEKATKWSWTNVEDEDEDEEEAQDGEAAKNKKKEAAGYAFVKKELQNPFTLRFDALITMKEVLSFMQVGNGADLLPNSSSWYGGWCDCGCLCCYCIYLSAEEEIRLFEFSGKVTVFHSVRYFR